jgi:type IX secretion system PorP/SprF family membrane protein
LRLILILDSLDHLSFKESVACSLTWHHFNKLNRISHFLVICFIFITTFIITGNQAAGQQTPYYPISYRVFSPFIFNPAIAGSKDFASLDLMISNYGKSNSQIASGNLRLAKPDSRHISTLSSPEFTNLGLGGYFFNDQNGLSRNIGIGVSASYHLQLDKKALSFLSFGLSAKAVYNHFSGDPDLSKPAENTFFPNIDAGLYYYNTRLFAGISATNLLGNPHKPDTLGFNSIPVSRQFFSLIGYKLVLSRSMNIVLEPSLIININTADTVSEEISDIFKPGLKFYADNFCVGTYFNNFKKISFFLQYQYAKFSLGTYFELPYNTPFYKQPILTEFVLGINLSAIKSGISRRNHW